MRVHSLSRPAQMGIFLVSLLFAVSFVSADDKTTFEVVGTAECADCKVYNIKNSQAFSGLRVSIDCKLKNGEMKRMGDGELDKEGKFRVVVTNELKDDCYAQLHSAAAIPCAIYEASKIVFKSQSNGLNTFGPNKNLQFSTTLCTSKTFLHHTYPPLPKLTHPWIKNYPKITFPPYKHYHSWPPLPPFYKHKPLHPPVPIYVPPVVKPLPPPVPIYKPKPPVYKPKPLVPIYKPKPPVYKPKPPVPIYKPKPPVYKPKPPVPVYKPKPPVYKPKSPVYKPKPPMFKPLHPPIPTYKKPYPPLPKLPPLPKIPPKYSHHPKFGHFPPLPPHFPHH